MKRYEIGLANGHMVVEADAWNVTEGGRLTLTKNVGEGKAEVVCFVPSGSYVYVRLLTEPR